MHTPDDALIAVATLAAWGCSWSITPTGVSITVPPGLPHGPIRELAESCADALHAHATQAREDA